MELQRIEEFEEAELLYGNNRCTDDGDARSSREKGEASSSDSEHEGPPSPHSMDLNVAYSGSGKSTSIMMAADLFEEDLFFEEEPLASSSNQCSGVKPDDIMPAATANIRMGSSVPMNIPLYKWKKAEDIEAEAPVSAHDVAVAGAVRSGFVPPHQLASQQHSVGFAFSLATGELKRDRLRARNAILKSTGFLEEQSQYPTAHQSVYMLERSSLVAGGLSQALHGTAQ